MAELLIMFVEVYFQTSSTHGYWGLKKRKLLKARNKKEIESLLREF